MEVHNINKLPENYTYGYGNLREFDSYELTDIKQLEVDEVWYWYSEAAYEGAGQVLMRKGDLYDIHDAGHCSCYGATCRISFKGVNSEKLIKSISKEYINEVSDLLKIAGLI